MSFVTNVNKSHHLAQFLNLLDLKIRTMKLTTL
jgi:hypothetical protein